MSDHDSSTYSSSEYFTADEESDVDCSEILLEPEFLLWLSSDGTKWFLPKYYKPEFDLNFCVSKFEKIMQDLL